MDAFSGEIERQGSLKGYADEYSYTNENIMIQTCHFYMNSRLSCIHEQVKTTTPKLDGESGVLNVVCCDLSVVQHI